MKQRMVNHCQCEICLSGRDHPDRDVHRQINYIMSHLNSNQRRLLVAFEAQQLGRGGIARMALITGLDRKTIRRGLVELKQSIAS